LKDLNYELAAIMEVDQVNSTDVLRDFPEWDSLTVLSVISMIHTNYGVCLSASDMRGVDTPDTLYHLVTQKIEP